MSARILIVEDEAITALDLEQQLNAMGHKVVGITNSAAAAVKAATELKPGLVLMDIRLSGDIDGITAASAIRGYDNIPVVFITAHADATTLERALQAAPFGYILKPFQNHELKVCIEVALYKHRKESEITQLVMKLEAALAKVNSLTELIALCPQCKKKAEFKLSEHADDSESISHPSRE